MNSYNLDSVLRDPCTPRYLRDAIREFITHDPVDALASAEVLVELMRARLLIYQPKGETK